MRPVVFSPEAREDLLQLYMHIADRAGTGRARSFTGRITAYCRGLANFPERGRRRDDLRPGLRVVGFERRAAVVFHVMPDAVVIDRLLYGGRELTSELIDRDS